MTDLGSDIISDSVAEDIAQYLTKKIREENRRAVSMPEIYFDNVMTFGKVKQIEFVKSLSVAIKQGRIKGFEVKLGKGGGVGPIGPKTITVSKPTPKPEPVVKAKHAEPALTESPALIPLPAPPPKPILKLTPPPPREICELSIGDRKYLVPFSSGKVKMILVNVFGAKDDLEGDILFEGTKYKCPDEHSQKYFDSFVFFVLGAEWTKDYPDVRLRNNG